MTLLSGLLQERGCCRCFTIAVFSINLLTLVPGHIKAFTEDYTHILCWSICPTKQLKCHCEIYLIVKYKIQQFWFLNQVLRCQDADSRLKWETGETRAARTGQSTKCSENKRFPGLLPIAWRFKIPSWNKEKRTRKRLPKYKKEKTMPLLLIQTSSGMVKYHTFPLLFWTLSLRGDWNKFPFPFKRKEKIVMNFERDNSLI